MSGGGRSYGSCLPRPGFPGIGISLLSLEVGAQVRSCLVTQRAVFFERLVQDALKLHGQYGVEPERLDGLAIEDSVEDHARGCAGKGLIAGRHFIKNHPAGKQIRAGIEFLAANLFR